MCIAHNTGIGCSACQIFVNEIVYYKISELFSDIKYVVRKSMVDCCCSSIIKRIYVTTSGFLFTSSCTGIIPSFHGYTNYFIALFMQHQCNYSAIDSSTHGHQYFTVPAHAFFAKLNQIGGGRVVEMLNLLLN